MRAKSENRTLPAPQIQSLPQIILAGHPLFLTSDKAYHNYACILKPELHLLNFILLMNGHMKSYNDYTQCCINIPLCEYSFFILLSVEILPIGVLLGVLYFVEYTCVHILKIVLS